MIFPDHITHSMVRMEIPDPAKEGFLEPHSAGFMFTTEDGDIDVEDRPSTSLNIGPKPGDKIWLLRAMAGFNMTFFLHKNGKPLMEF